MPRSPLLAGGLLLVVLLASSLGAASSPRDGTTALDARPVASNLTVAIVAAPAHGAAPLTVDFTAEVNGAVGSAPVVTWSFGDGGGGTGPQLNYTYARPGNFTVRATAEDAGSRFANASLVIDVGPTPGDGPAPVAPLPTWAVLGAAAAVGAALGAVGYRLVVGRRGATAPLGGLPRAAPPGIPEIPAPITPSGSPAPSPAPVTVAAVPVIPPLRPSVAPARSDSDPASVGSTSAEERRRLSERVITHLLWFGHPTNDGIARVEATQQGMARRLDAGQNSVSKVLLRLEAAGIVRVQTEHVPGAPRRVKTYTLTARGEAVARAIERASGRRGPSN